MANTIINKVVYPAEVQMHLQANLVADRICGRHFETALQEGQQVIFPYFNDVQVGTYSYSGNNTVRNSTATTDSYSITDPVYTAFQYDPLQNRLFQDPQWMSEQTRNMGYQLARRIDQYVLNVGIAGAFATVAGGTITSSSMLSLLATVDATLTQNQARVGTRFIVMDPYTAMLLPQMDASFGFQAADMALRAGTPGFIGQTSLGLMVYQSINLPYSVTYTMASDPADADTVTIYGVTYTFKTTAVNPGEVVRGAGAAATQANLKACINNSGTGAGTDYVTLSAANLALNANGQVVCGTFGTNAAAITAFGRIHASGTGTQPGTFGTETFSMIAGVEGVIDLTMQVEPYVKESDYITTSGTFSNARTVSATQQFGAGVFHQDAPSLVKVTANAYTG